MKATPLMTLRGGEQRPLSCSLATQHSRDGRRSDCYRRINVYWNTGGAGVRRWGGGANSSERGIWPTSQPKFVRLTKKNNQEIFFKLVQPSRIKDEKLSKFDTIFLDLEFLIFLVVSKIK